jgi:hypothetical protein
MIRKARLVTDKASLARRQWADEQHSLLLDKGSSIPCPEQDVPRHLVMFGYSMSFLTPEILKMFTIPHLHPLLAKTC